MWMLILYIIVSGMPMEAGYRSADGVNPDKFPTKEACEEQRAKDMKAHAELRREDLKLVCERR
jgi:hypothetical protein